MGPEPGFPKLHTHVTPPRVEALSYSIVRPVPNLCWAGFRPACPRVLIYAKNTAASGPVVTSGQRSLHHAQLRCQLLLDLLHVLLINLNLLARIAQDKPYVPRNGAQAQNFAAAIQRSLCADPVRAVRRLVVAHLQRKRG